VGVRPGREVQDSDRPASWADTGPVTTSAEKLQAGDQPNLTPGLVARQHRCPTPRPAKMPPRLRSISTAEPRADSRIVMSRARRLDSAEVLVGSCRWSSLAKLR
jgi:hypothetical protein